MSVPLLFSTSFTECGDNEIKILNVAGPRASKESGVGDFVKEVLDTAFQPH